ncbi:serine/threonine protein kinase [Halalkalibacter krulwichiae]|uniref:Protein kinase domain-containing protein n=1 Tax=Halalkalibacter krulwichiae TaxID=199441 RepID=A0A1X9MC79_9BACI|nr:serine/threonine protein kinase [Halalkalibacter krulwichiae]ARK29753.1 hypothetical protein BkAM31D_07695 [Halalkalibacter krulwichiae]
MIKIEQFKQRIEEELLPYIVLSSLNQNDPIVVKNNTKDWQLVGSGNYASVFSHPSEKEIVVKVYGREVEAIKDEIRVYEALGNHPAYSELYGYGENYLILKRITGITLYDAVIKGVAISPKVLMDIEKAIDYAKKVGLNPFDVHGKNIVMQNEKGIIVDVSDFYKSGVCKKWEDLQTAYKWFYQPFLLKNHPRIPVWMLNLVRKGYRVARGIVPINKRK